MKKLGHISSDATVTPYPNSSINSRLFSAMVVAIGLAVLGAIVFSNWRVAAGLLLGGVLSLLNLRWMRSSVASAFAAFSPGTRPQIGLIKFVLRYIVIGFTIFVAYKLGLISLPATIVGLCSFVAALFFEAARELYFSLVRREEIR